MHDCDVTLKALLTESVQAILRQIGAQGEVAQWLNVELPKVQNQRVDLLSELTTGEILHIELQSTNDAEMPLRMLDYAVAIRKRLDKFPRQLVLYVGNSRLSMAASFQSPAFDFRYDLLDIRDIDPEALLGSEHISENLLAILTENSDSITTIRRIMGKIARLEHPRREDAVRKLLILSGMRGFAAKVQQERNKMPVTFDIMDNEVLGPLIRRGLQQGIEQGLEQGLEQGREQGLEQGRQQGSREILRALLRKRFGVLPAWAEARLSASSVSQANDFALRLLDAESLEEIFNL